MPYVLHSREDDRYRPSWAPHRCCAKGHSVCSGAARRRTPNVGEGTMAHKDHKDKGTQRASAGAPVTRADAAVLATSRIRATK